MTAKLSLGRLILGSTYFGVTQHTRTLRRLVTGFLSCTGTEIIFRPGTTILCISFTFSVPVLQE